MKYIPIRSYDNYIKASIELSLLKEAGINCHLKDEFTVTIDPLLSPALGGMKLMVSDEQLQMARKILEESDELYLKTIACPSCHQNTLQQIVETTHYDSLGGKLRSLLINGQQMQVKQYYRCIQCGNKMNELPRSA